MDHYEAYTNLFPGLMIHRTITQQMQILGLMWDSDQPIVTDSDELPMSLTQLRMKQRQVAHHLCVRCEHCMINQPAYQASILGSSCWRRFLGSRIGQRTNRVSFLLAGSIICNNNRRPKADMDAAGNWLHSVTDLLSKNSFKALSFYLMLVPLYHAFT